MYEIEMRPRYACSTPDPNPNPVPGPRPQPSPDEPWRALTSSDEPGRTPHQVRLEMCLQTDSWSAKLAHACLASYGAADAATRFVRYREHERATLGTW